MTECRVLVGCPAMRLHKRQSALAGPGGWEVSLSIPSLCSRRVAILVMTRVTEFHLLMASWESLAVARPLWETGLLAADIGERGGRCRLSGALYCWGGMSHSMGTGGTWPARVKVHSIHASGLTASPVKVRSRDKIIWSMPFGAALQSLKGLQVSSVCSFSAASTSPFTSCSG